MFGSSADRWHQRRVQRVGSVFLRSAGCGRRRGSCRRGGETDRVLQQRSGSAVECRRGRGWRFDLATWLAAGSGVIKPLRGVC